MADDELKMAAQKELLRRQAKAELARREAAKAQQPEQAGMAPASSGEWGIPGIFTVYRTTPAAATQQLDDSVRTLVNGMTLGYADKFAGLMSGEGTQAERARSAEAAQRLNAGNGPSAGALEIAGSLLPATKLAQMGITAARIPGWVGKYGGLIIDGAAYGALDAAGHDKPVLQGAGVGGLLGLGGQIVGKGVESVYNKVRTAPIYSAMRKSAPDFEKVAAQKDALYGALDNAGVKFDANAYDQMLADTSQALKNFRATKAPMTADTVNYMAQFQGQSPSFRDVEDILQEAKGILREKNATDADKKAAGIVVDQLSKFFDNAAVATNGSIPAGEVSGMVKSARELARRHILAKDVAKMQNKSEWYVSGDESGMRNQFASYGKRNAGSMTKMERDAAKSVVRREGLLSSLNQAGTKLGQIALGSTGFAVGGLPGLAAATGGHFIARKASEKLTEKAVNDYVKTVLAGRAAQNKAAQTAGLLEMTPRQRLALQSALRAGTFGLLGSASQ